MREQGAALYEWLQRGAYVYVCGDATRMAHDVNTALLEIIARRAASTTPRPRTTSRNSKSNKRYLRDVY